MDIRDIKREKKVYMHDDPFDATYIVVSGVIRVTPSVGKPFDQPFRLAISYWCTLVDKHKEEADKPTYQLHWDESEMSQCVPFQETTPCVVGRSYFLNQEGKDGFCTDPRKYTTLEYEKDGSYTLYIKGDRKHPVKFSPASTPRINACLKEIYTPYQ